MAPTRSLSAAISGVVLILSLLVVAGRASAGEASVDRDAAPAARSIATLFGSTAERLPHSALNPRWRAAAWPRIKGDEGPWAQAFGEARALPKAERPAFVNRWVNGAIRFREDIAQYGERDHWADIAQSTASGEGDCEDYAIAKLQLLRALGYSARDLYMVIVRDTAQNLDHAVLVVRTGNGFLLLDNQNSVTAHPAAFPAYRPMLGFNNKRVWVYRQALAISVARAAP